MKSGVFNANINIFLHTTQILTIFGAKVIIIMEFYNLKRGIFVTYTQIDRLTILITASFILMIAPFLYAGVKYILNINRKEKTVFSLPLSRKLMIISVFLVASVWLMRAAVSYFSEIIGIGEGLRGFEILTDSFIKALKTMGVSDDYSDFISAGKIMMKVLAPGKNYLEKLFVIQASLLNVAAPLAGGALIFDVLTSIFPKLRLTKSFLRRQFYFSELNERSLALAKSVFYGNHKFGSKPLLVFTDTYLDDESEKSSELFIEAKKLGAVCINDDLAHLNVGCLREKQIFLMDNDESSNIRTLSALCQDGKNSLIKKSQIYVFYQDDSYAMVEKRIYEEVKSHFDEEGMGAKVPVFIRVKEYENLILKLLEEMPLTQPLLSRKHEKPFAKKDYNLTIIGSGKIGMQMFLSSAWAGQFFGYNLKINVVSEEECGNFVSRVNKINPEILKSTQEKTSLLKIYKDPDDESFADPYFSLRYGKYNFENTDITQMKCADVYNPCDAFSILDSDYIFVALGNDEFNMSVAEDLERKISVLRDDDRTTVISYVVYNENFCSILNNDKPLNHNIIMHPFGSVDQTYSYENVTMVQNDSGAKSVADVYDKSFSAKRENQEMRLEKKIYDSLSSKAREVHLKYRIFSAYLFLYAGSDNGKYNPVTDYGTDTLKKYKDEILSCNAGDEVLQYLAWLEHRRWNAYMRSIGFSYKEMKGKNINRKIHGCLVECSETMTHGQEDMLDAAAALSENRELKKYDFPKETDEKIIDIMIANGGKLNV